MISTKEEYNKRLAEVNIYFDTFTLLDKGNCKIICTDILGSKPEKDIDTNLSTILKANGFLLLYNLVEATIRNSINAIFVSVHSKNLTFKDVTDNLRKLWINQEIKNIKKADVITLTKKILENELMTFKAECINIGGNIDAQRIRDIAKQFGYQESKNGRDLVTIKDKRNKLAHGNSTFSDIGKDYTVKDLIRFKDNTKSYLDDVLQKIEDYINNDGFSSTNT
jgi:hypothetical protein